MNGGGVEEEAAAVVRSVRKRGAVDADHSAVGENLKHVEVSRESLCIRMQLTGFSPSPHKSGRTCRRPLLH